MTAELLPPEEELALVPNAVPQAGPSGAGLRLGETDRVGLDGGYSGLDQRSDPLMGAAVEANLAAIELHVPLAYADDPETPTHMVFDLDPGAPAGIKECAKIALELRELFKRLKLQCCIKSSGSKGLHVYVPFNTKGIGFADTKNLARAIALMMEEQDERVVSDMSKAKRKGKKRKAARKKR